MAKSAFIKAFGERVRKARESQGISQEELAAQAGIHRTGITRIERATRSSTLDVVAKLAIALGVQPADLMPPVEIKRSATVRRKRD